MPAQEGQGRVALGIRGVYADMMDGAIEMLFRPGPSRLPPGQAPGGMIFRVYNEREVMLVDRVLLPGDSCESARDDAITTLEALPAGGEVYLVAYDGDTGRRWTPEDWAELEEITT